MSAADLCDFVGSTILDPLSRVDGVGEVSLFGAPYAHANLAQPLEAPLIQPDAVPT